MTNISNITPSNVTQQKIELPSPLCGAGAFAGESAPGLPTGPEGGEGGSIPPCSLALSGGQTGEAEGRGSSGLKPREVEVAGGGFVPTSLAQEVLPFTATSGAPTDLAQQPLPFKANPLVEAWSSYLDDIGRRIGTGWQLYITLTFQGLPHPEKASKQFRRFRWWLDERLYSRSKLRRGRAGLTWAVASERQDRGALHFHALVGGDERLTTMSCTALAREWWNQGLVDGVQVHTGIARVARPRYDGLVRAYVSKYVAKTGGGMDLYVPYRVRRSWGQQVALNFVPVG